MGKGRIFGSIGVLALIAVVASWAGCGSSNDQGVSFRALGFFVPSTGGGSTSPQGDTGRCVSLRDETIVTSALGLQNGMVGQGISLGYVNLSYHVSGSSLAFPGDVAALAGYLGPANGQTTNPSTGYFEIPVVSPAIFKFVNDNTSRLPPLPFSMVATASAIGTADSGDNFQTNSVNYEIQFTALSGGCAIPTPTPGESIEGSGSATP